jgi:hypothetical protein
MNRFIREKFEDLPPSTEPLALSAAARLTDLLDSSNREQPRGVATLWRGVCTSPAPHVHGPFKRGCRDVDCGKEETGKGSRR